MVLSPGLHLQEEQLSSNPKITESTLEGASDDQPKTSCLVCDFEGTLLGSTSLFPYFMLVAFEGGSLLRALLLLLSCPLLWLLGGGQHMSHVSSRVMAFITFCGLRTKDVELVARAVLPKFYMDNLRPQALELLLSAAASGQGHVVLTSMPRLMVERFLKDHLAVSHVVGAEVVQVAGGCYLTGIIRRASPDINDVILKQKADEDHLSGKPETDVLTGGRSSTDTHDRLFFGQSKETCSVKKESNSSISQKGEKYPKPIIFHDGRLVSLPTPSVILSIFMWIPFGILLFIFRIFLGCILPKFSFLLGAAVSGVRLRAHGLENINTRTHKGVLYVCNHRTLVDPVMLSTVVQRSVPAVTFSLSRLAEMVSPIKTLRLTRDRATDSAIMRRIMSQGDLAICPEGTTCREPYLLRFSSLFAELTDEMIPVAMDARMSMMYATTATGHKWLDPVVFFLDPTPEYRVEILEPVPPEMTCSGGRSPKDVANWIQKQLSKALGFECTSLTRRDKYMILAGERN